MEEVVVEFRLSQGIAKAEYVEHSLSMIIQKEFDEKDVDFMLTRPGYTVSQRESA